MPSTPPSSPSSGRDAAHHLECTHRIMGSPENCHIPNGPSVPSSSTHTLNQNLLRGPPSDLTSRLLALAPPPIIAPAPPPHNSTSTLAPPPIITSMAAPAPPSHRETLTPAQLAAAYAALPPLNSHHQNATSSHRETLTSSQLRAAYAALPPLNPPNSRPRPRPLAVSV